MGGIFKSTLIMKKWLSGGNLVSSSFPAVESGKGFVLFWTSLLFINRSALEERDVQLNSSIWSLFRWPLMVNTMDLNGHLKKTLLQSARYSIGLLMKWEVFLKPDSQCVQSLKNVNIRVLLISTFCVCVCVLIKSPPQHNNQTQELTPRITHCDTGKSQHKIL